MTYPECFMIANWYPIFEKHTVPTKLIKIDSKLLEYINDERFIHPTDYFHLPQTDSDFETAVTICINSFDGKCYAKMLWNSPKDSGWLTFTNQPMVSSFTDLALMLKNSVRILPDVKYIQDNPKAEHRLALRKWEQIDESLEFRCFVSNKRLIACCQRNIKGSKNNVKKTKSKIILAISKFISKEFLPCWKHSHSFVLDVFLDYQFNVTIMDISPLDSEHVDPILFQWKEIIHGATRKETMFRCNRSTDCFYIDKNGTNGFPIEFCNDVLFNSTHKAHLKEFKENVSLLPKN